MISVYKETVKDALYPKKKGTLRKDNKYIYVSEVKMMEAGDIKRLRLSLSLSVSLFASVLSVSSKTVEAWESGKNVPSGPALRMMNILSRNPDVLTDCDIVKENYSAR